MCFGAQKNRLIETVLLSTHNICFGREIRKIIFSCALLSGGAAVLNPGIKKILKTFTLQALSLMFSSEKLTGAFILP